jgi:hypothetical protein
MKNILSMAAAMVLCSVAVSAAGTASGTDVTNTATLSFSVGSVAQTDVTSNTDTFKVDKKIDFVLTHSDAVKHLIVVANNKGNNRTFTLTNESNEIQDFTVAVSNLTGNESYDSKIDSADMQNLEISIDGGSTWAIGPVTVDNLAVDGNLTIKVQGDVLASAIDGEVMNVQLEATAVQDGTTTPEVNTGNADGTDRKAVVDTVLGEGAGVSDFANTQFDGKYSAWSGYLVNTPNIDLTKLSCVWKDEVTTDLTKSKRIPGATVVYVFDLNNTSASTDATGVTLADTLSTDYDVTGTVASAKAITGVVAASPCTCTYGDETGGNGGTVLGADASLSGQVLTLANLSVTKNSHTCVSVQVKLK